MKWLNSSGQFGGGDVWKVNGLWSIESIDYEV